MLRSQKNQASVVDIELEYTERLCYYVHGVRIENTPLPCLPAQANRAGRKTNAAPKVSYESSVSPISMVKMHRKSLSLLAGIKKLEIFISKHFIL